MSFMVFVSHICTYYDHLSMQILLHHHILSYFTNFQGVFFFFYIDLNFIIWMLQNLFHQ